MDERYEHFTVGGGINRVFGADLVSATTVAITHRYHRVSGTATIQTISPPWVGFAGEVVLIPLAAFVLGTSGNIVSGLTAVVDVPIELHFDGLNWRPTAGSGGGAGTSAPVYEESTTAPNGSQTTFAFPDAVGTLITAYIGGVAQLPADVTVSAGSIVFGHGIVPTDPTVDRVSALFVKA
jgi:hypothetical protein